jgi:mRNA interferase MazF
VVICQGDIWWADLGEPPGSVAGYRRPVLIVQSDAINRSRLATALCVPLTSNLAWAKAPGNLLLAKKVTGLDRDSVAQTTLMLAIDKACLTERAGRIAAEQLERVLAQLDVVLARE